MAGLDADAVVGRTDSPDARAKRVVAFALAVLRGGEAGGHGGSVRGATRKGHDGLSTLCDAGDTEAGLDDRERRQIRAAARVMDFTNRTGNTVDRWLHRLKRAGRVNGGNFLSDLIITVIWAMVALPVGAALMLIPTGEK